MPSCDIAYSVMEVVRLQLYEYASIADNLRIALQTVGYLKKLESEVANKIIDLHRQIEWKQNQDRYYASGGFHPCYD